MMQLMQAALKVRQPGSVCQAKHRIEWLGELKARAETQGGHFDKAAYVVASAGTRAGAAVTASLLHAIWWSGHPHGFVCTKVLVRA